jgi:hypothetical protein
MAARLRSAGRSRRRARGHMTLESFYSAMKAGDATKAMTFIAPDAVFVESGRLETRAEYGIYRAYVRPVSSTT